MATPSTKPFIHPFLRRPVKLGRPRPSLMTEHHRQKRMALNRFMSKLAAAPAVTDNTYGIKSWGMMENDVLGDCTIACPGHMIQTWTASAGKEQTVSDTVIIDAYSAWDGYVIGNPNTDNGGVISVVLQDWLQQGLGGFKISEYAAVNLTQYMIQQVIFLFGAADVGIQLPITAQAQVGSVWDIVGDGQTGDSAPGSWGGHCIAVPMYTPTGPVCVTWGALQPMTWRFLMNYADEAWAVISPNWKSPSATPTAQLESELAELTGSTGGSIVVSLPAFTVNP